MDNASEEYRVKAAEWTALDAAARMLEEGKTTYLAQRMTAFADMAVSKAEREVKSSQDWAGWSTPATGAAPWSGSTTGVRSLTAG